jgi:hypothetical protein
MFEGVSLPSSSESQCLYSERVLVTETDSRELLLTLERGETDGHLGDDTGDNGTETLVETKTGLTGNDLLASSEETEGLALWRVSICWSGGAWGSRWSRQELTPVPRPFLESCMRTLMVSRGWLAVSDLCTVRVMAVRVMG